MTGSAPLVPPDLLEILQCPSCGGSLEEIAEPAALACTTCGLRYPVEDGIPVMLIEEAAAPDGD
ncbi:MAG: Trm112 family protein [Acidimicrobiia bacterium]